MSDIYDPTRYIFPFFRERFIGEFPSYTPEQTRALERAREDWKRRAKEAEVACKLPEGAFRIRGDSEAGFWYVEKAIIECSRMPYQGGTIEATLANLRENEPVAEIEWETIYDGDYNGFRTYAKALAFLKECLQPVSDESIYFNAVGTEVRGGQ
jgi:hypothetical protein